MPLFGGDRDISLLRTFNKELINDAIEKLNFLKSQFHIMEGDIMKERKLQ